jgi:hypothetical protein
MNRRAVVALCATVLAVASLRAAGQSKAFIPGRTPHGQPDLRGMWEMPLTRESKYEMFEYACEEGNYATPNMLVAGRAVDGTLKK